MGGSVVGDSYGSVGGSRFWSILPQRHLSHNVACGGALTCVAYFYKPNEVLLGLPHISDYNAEAHAQYQVLLVRSVVGFSSNFVLVVSGGNRQVRVLGCEWCLYRQVCA